MRYEILVVIVLEKRYYQVQAGEIKEKDNIDTYVDNQFVLDQLWWLIRNTLIITHLIYLPSPEPLTQHTRNTVCWHDTTCSLAQLSTFFKCVDFKHEQWFSGETWWWRKSCTGCWLLSWLSFFSAPPTLSPKMMILLSDYRTIFFLIEGENSSVVDSW